MIDIFFANPGAAASLRQAGIGTRVLNFERNLAVGDIAADEDEPLLLKEPALGGEPLRLWLSERPEEMCGLYWLAHWLYKWEAGAAEVSAVKLPWFVELPDGVAAVYAHWGEVLPEKEVWQQYAARAQKLPANFMLGCALDWQELQKQNAPRRIRLDGCLISAGEDFYADLFKK